MSTKARRRSNKRKRLARYKREKARASEIYHTWLVALRLIDSMDELYTIQKETPQTGGVGNLAKKMACTHEIQRRNREGRVREKRATYQRWQGSILTQRRTAWP